MRGGSGRRQEAYVHSLRQHFAVVAGTRSVNWPERLFLGRPGSGAAGGVAHLRCVFIASPGIVGGICIKYGIHPLGELIKFPRRTAKSIAIGLGCGLSGKILLARTGGVIRISRAATGTGGRGYEMSHLTR